MGPMTQYRSRMLGVALIAIAGALKLSWFVGAFRWRSFLATVLLGIVVLPIVAILFWSGVTIAVMNWDDPADYPPGDEQPPAV